MSYCNKRRIQANVGPARDGSAVDVVTHHSRCAGSPIQRNVVSECAAAGEVDRGWRIGSVARDGDIAGGAARSRGSECDVQRNDLAGRDDLTIGDTG